MTDDEEEDRFEGWFDDPTGWNGDFGGVAGFQGGSEEDQEERRIAEQYDADLSGENGPVARMRAVQELSRNAAEEALESGLDGAGLGTYRMQQEPEENLLNPNAKPFGATETQNIENLAVPFDEPWSLVATAQTDTTTTWRIVPGRVFLTFGDRGTIADPSADGAAEVSITNVTSSITVQEDGMVWLKLHNIASDPPTLTLESGTPPLDWPKTFKTESVGAADEEVTEAYFPLWQFYAQPIPEFTYGVRISDDLWGRQCFKAADSAIVWGIHNKDVEFRKINVPILVPLG